MRGAIVPIAMLLTAATPALADPPDISARRLLSGWKDQDASTRMLAEVIASAFAGGLSWRGSLEERKSIARRPIKGRQVMIAFEKFLEDNPDMAEKPYGDAMAASLSRAFPCQAQ